MIRHETSYWLTMTPDDTCPDAGFRAAAAAAARKLEPFSIVPAETGPDETARTVAFEIEPGTGTIQYTSAVLETIRDLAAEYPAVRFYLEEIDEENQAEQCATLCHGDKSLISCARLTDYMPMDRMILAMENPDEAWKLSIRERLDTIANDVRLQLVHDGTEPDPSVRACLERIAEAVAALA